MRYDRYDIVKIEVPRQRGYLSESYVLVCPYVRMTRGYSDSMDGRSAMAYVTLLGLDTGRLHPNFAMNLDFTGSVLKEAAHAD